MSASSTTLTDIPPLAVKSLVSSLALSVAGADVLPAGSDIVAVTMIVAPSAGFGNVVVTYLFAMSVAVSIIGVEFPALSLTVMISPTSALSILIFTRTDESFSLALMNPSLFASVMISTPFVAVKEGTLVSIVIVNSSDVLPKLPALSSTLAV